MKPIHLIISVLFYILTSPLNADAQTNKIRKWEVFSVSFHADNEPLNPYAEILAVKQGDLLEVHFTGISGEAKGKQINLVGFWNGGKEWRANFAAPYTGIWEYKTVSADRSLNNKKGRLEVVAWTEAELMENPARRGVIHVNVEGDNAGRHFMYADGHPFLWVGDTWWNWTKRSIKMETWQMMVDDRAARGFTVGQLFVPGNGWGRESSLHDPTYNELDTRHMEKVEQMIAYANLKGITVWIHGWWSRPDLDKTIGDEKMQRWWRYLVHRLGAYNVIWVLAGEYNMHNNAGFDISFWKQLGELVKDEDPYKRIVSLHNTPPFWDGGAEAPQWSTGEVLHSESWLDYNQSQTGHGKYANEMIPVIIQNEYRRQPAKPIVVTEPWYEFVEGNPTGMDVRLAAWGSILSGAAGHTYGGGHVWQGSVPESPAGGGGPWPVERGAELSSFSYEGAVSMQHLAGFFKKIKWWEMTPRPDLISDYPQPFCLARPGAEYVVYLRYGGMIHVDMGESAVGKNFSYYWYNPSTGEAGAKREITGKATLQFISPGMYPGSLEYSDWVLHVFKHP
jgi:hypothetical protein